MSDAGLETERLILRAPVEADARAVRDFHARNRERFDRWEPKRSHEVEEHARWIAWRRTEDAAGRARSWLAFERGAPEHVVAHVALDAISVEPERGAMLSYAVDGPFEGRGFAREATAAVIAYAFGELDLRALSAYYDPANDRSGGLLKRLGFVVVAQTPVIPGFERHMRAQVLAWLGRPTEPV